MKYVFSMTLALALLASAPALAKKGQGGKNKGDKIDVMTQNQYLGADLDPVISAPADEFNDAVIDALSSIAANDISARSEALAELIAKRLPELAGLQEMFRFECYDLGPPTLDTGCNDPRIANAFPVEEMVEIAPGVSVLRSVGDHLQLTLDALAELDETYVDVATVNNLDLTQTLPGLPTPGLPVFLNDDLMPDITVTVLDRDVILARGDIADDVTPLDQVLPLSQLCPARAPESPGDPPDRTSGNGCNYNVVASVLDTPIGDISIERGWVGVDYTNGDTTYRFVDTHLEVQFLAGNPGTGDVPLGFIQAFQAAELVGVLATSGDFAAFDHLIIVGDINSGPTDPPFMDPAPQNPIPSATYFPPYKQLANGEGLFVGAPLSPLDPLTDAWDLRPGNQPGYTCCQGKPVLVDDEGNPLPGSPLPGNLLNQQSNLDERIDVIFSLHELSRVKKARVLGAKVSDKTPPAGLGLWPSDHGSVAVELQFD